MSKESYPMFEHFLLNPKVKDLVEKGPINLDCKNKFHIIIFRKILEHALTQGRWHGRMAQVS